MSQLPARLAIGPQRPGVPRRATEPAVRGQLALAAGVALSRPTGRRVPQGAGRQGPQDDSAARAGASRADLGKRRGRDAPGRGPAAPPQARLRAGDAGRGALRAADRPVEAGRVAHPAAIGQGAQREMAVQRLPLRHSRLRDLHDPPRPGPSGHAQGGGRRPGSMAASAERAEGSPGAGKPWNDFDREKETVRLGDQSGTVVVQASYR